MKVGTMSFYMDDGYFAISDTEIFRFQDEKYRVYSAKQPYYWASFSIEPEEWETAECHPSN